MVFHIVSVFVQFHRSDKSHITFTIEFLNAQLYYMSTFKGTTMSKFRVLSLQNIKYF